MNEMRGDYRNSLHDNFTFPLRDKDGRLKKLEVTDSTKLHKVANNKDDVDISKALFKLVTVLGKLLAEK